MLVDLSGSFDNFFRKTRHFPLPLAVVIGIEYSGINNACPMNEFILKH